MTTPTNTPKITDVIDSVWDSLNEATNHATQPYAYEDVARAVREALDGAAAGYADDAGAQVSPVQTTDRAEDSVDPSGEIRTMLAAIRFIRRAIDEKAADGAGAHVAESGSVVVGPDTPTEVGK